MKTLENHTLVYDSDCPMCDLYTKGFVKTGMLDDHGRVAYGCARVPVTFSNERAKNEIALIDYDNGTVTYGLDSLIKVIAHSFPLLGRILGFRIVRAPLNMLYSFISYNRKVIAPPKVFEKRGACTPDYKVGYRVAYIVFAWLVTSLILANYFKLSSVLTINALLIAGQMIFIQMIAPEKMLHYIGNVMTVILIGSLLLFPLSAFKSVPLMVMIMWVSFIVLFTLIQFVKRLEYLELIKS